MGKNQALYFENSNQTRNPAITISIQHSNTESSQCNIAKQKIIKRIRIRK
jgi:hypothetical protein